MWLTLSGAGGLRAFAIGGRSTISEVFSDRIGAMLGSRKLDELGEAAGGGWNRFTGARRAASMRENARWIAGTAGPPSSMQPCATSGSPYCLLQPSPSLLQLTNSCFRGLRTITSSARVCRCLESSLGLQELSC